MLKDRVGEGKKEGEGGERDIERKRYWREWREWREWR